MLKKGIHPNCYPCIIQQVRSTVKCVSLGVEDEQKVLDIALEQILMAKKQPILVQHIVRRTADAIQEKFKKNRDFDLYAEIKKKSHEIALSFIPRFRKELLASSDSIAFGIRLAAAGNIIDFGAKAHGSLDIEKELGSVDSLVFGKDDTETFKKKISTAGLLLYIADNVGEILFDRLLIEALQMKYPKLKIIVAVRDKPIINDATLEDAREAGLMEVAQVISSGSLLPGTILEETSTAFQEWFKKADVIISKGQGNFETLFSVSDPRLFFLLRIKCETMANLADQKMGELVFMQGIQKNG